MFRELLAHLCIAFGRVAEGVKQVELPTSPVAETESIQNQRMAERFAAFKRLTENRKLVPREWSDHPDVIAALVEDMTHKRYMGWSDDAIVQSYGNPEDETATEEFVEKANALLATLPVCFCKRCDDRKGPEYFGNGKRCPDCDRRLDADGKPQA